MRFMFSHSPRVNTYPYMYCTFIFSHVARHACRLRCPSSLVVFLSVFDPSTLPLFLRKASGFRVMEAISVPHLVFFLQEIYGIHIRSSIGTVFFLQFKKFHLFPNHSVFLFSWLGYGYEVSSLMSILLIFSVYPEVHRSLLVISLFPQEFDGSNRGFDLLLQMPKWDCGYFIHFIYILPYFGSSRRT